MLKIGEAHNRKTTSFLRNLFPIESISIIEEGVVTVDREIGCINILCSIQASALDLLRGDDLAHAKEINSLATQHGGE